MKKRLGDQIYDAVVTDIIKGGYTRDSVITESGLIERYQVSKSPVRDALVRLCNEDILYSIPRYGYRLYGVDMDYFRQIILFRSKIECDYLDHYFHRINPGDLMRIEEAIQPFLAGQYNTPMEYWQKASYFHLALARACRDRFYLSTLESVLYKQLIAFSKLYWNDWGDIVDSKMQDHHSAIVIAIREGRKKDAIEALRRDIQNV